MENLKEGLELSLHNEGTSKKSRIISVIFYLIIGITFYSILSPSIEKIIFYFNLENTWEGHIISYFISIFLIMLTLVSPIILTFTLNQENPGVFYFKNKLIVFRNVDEGEIEIPLQMIKRVLLYNKDSVIIKYHEGFLDEVELPRLKKSIPLGEFLFKLNKKSRIVGPSLIDELNKKLN